MKKKTASILICALFAFTSIAAAFAYNTGTAAAASSSEVRGMWIAFCDFSALGLKNKNKATFTRNLDKALDKARYYGCNTIFWHARAFDDATWKSKTFKASKYLTWKANRFMTASTTYSYDPLAIVIQECHERGLKVEAWMNPYRISYSYFLNPASASTTKRINRAVNELQKYDLDGINFDDYFYHSQYKYISTSKATRYKITPKGSKTRARISASKKRKYVNRMVKSVRSNVHQKSGWKFGVCPQGNVENCMTSGADVKKWLGTGGYIDYICPQIYWTDNWGKSGKTKMFTGRLKQWKSLNKKHVNMYVGLALYMTGKKVSSDRGWAKRSTNMVNQVKKARAYGCSGYALFESSDLYRTKALTELNNLRNYLY